jgi:hypothetical protein
MLDGEPNRKEMHMRNLIHWLSPFVLLIGLGFSSAAVAAFTRIEENHISVTYEGDWRTVSNSAVSGGTVRVASAAGARVHVFFRGTSIRWIGYRCDCTRGTAWVYVDGVRKVITQMTAAASTPQAQSSIYYIDGLGSGPHTLTIELTGQEISGGTGNTFVAIDAFDIENGAPMRQLQENDPALTYTGAWMDVDDPSVSGGSVVATQEAGATATLRFSGNAVQWIGYRCPCTGGLAEVTIDEQDFGDQHNSYLASARQAQTLTFGYFGLPDGEHQMNIRVTGQNFGDSKWVVIDAFQVDATGSDTTAPDVTLTAPENNASVTGSVTLEATAQDNVGVTKVQFYAQPFGGDYLLIGEDTSPPYTLTRDTSSIPNGSQFRLRARAWDAANNFDDSSSVIVTINHTGDTTPPVVAITAPANGSTVAGTVNLTATATDNQRMQSVRFFIDGLGTDYFPTQPIGQPPYTMPLNTTFLKDGSHFVEANALDTAGNMSTARVSFTVDNSVQVGSFRIDDDHAALTYSGAWARHDDGELPLFHWDSAAYSTTPGATMTGTFQGTGIVWHGYRCEDCGTASVSIDGGPPQQVDTYEPNRPGAPWKFGAVVYSSPALTSGTHTFTLTVQPPVSGPPIGRVYVDALEIRR